MLTRKPHTRSLQQGGGSNTGFYSPQVPACCCSVSVLSDSLRAGPAPCFQLILCALSLQALFKLWGSSQRHRKDILTYTELVLDSQGQLVQMNRAPGGNQVVRGDLGKRWW